jgi:hypothetical protein
MTVENGMRACMEKEVLRRLVVEEESSTVGTIPTRKLEVAMEPMKVGGKMKGMEQKEQNNNGGVIQKVEAKELEQKGQSKNGMEVQLAEKKVMEQSGWTVQLKTMKLGKQTLADGRAVEELTVGRPKTMAQTATTAEKQEGQTGKKTMLAGLTKSES